MIESVCRVLRMVAAVSLILGGGLVGSPAANAEMPKEIVVSTGEYPPFNSKHFRHNGLIPKIITEAFRLQGIKVRYLFAPWARAYKQSELGEVDATAQWYRSEKRAKTHLYSDTILNETLVWFHLKENPIEWETLEDMQRYNIGAVTGYTYTAEFYRMIEAGELNVQFVTDDEQNYRKLLARRIDAIPEVLDVGLYIINNQFRPEVAQLFVQHPKIFDIKTTHLLVRRDHPHAEELIKAFNVGLARLRDGGLLDDYMLESRLGEYYPEGE